MRLVMQMVLGVVWLVLSFARMVMGMGRVGSAVWLGMSGVSVRWVRAGRMGRVVVRVDMRAMSVSVRLVMHIVSSRRLVVMGVRGVMRVGRWALRALRGGGEGS
jgi:hypothetical protein